MTADDETRNEGSLHTAPPASSVERRSLIFDPLWAFAKTTAGQASAGVVGVLVAGVVSWMTPLGTLVQDALWPEKIAIYSTGLPAVEKELGDLKFALTTQTRTGFSGGTVTVTSRDRSIELVGDRSFVLGASPGAVEVPKPGALRVKPLTTGTHRLDVVLITNRGRRFDGVVDVVVGQRRWDPGHEKVWTGRWHMTLNGVNGELSVVDSPNQHLTGTATLENGKIYQVDPDSWHDGTGFLLLLRNAGEHISIKGLKCEVSNTSEKWRILNGKVEVVAGDVGVNRRRALSTIVERCDRMMEALSTSPGNGAFEASIELSRFAPRSEAG